MGSHRRREIDDFPKPMESAALLKERCLPILYEHELRARLNAWPRQSALRP